MQARTLPCNAGRGPDSAPCTHAVEPIFIHAHGVVVWGGGRGGRCAPSRALTLHVPRAGDVATAVEDGIGVPPFFCPILRDGDFTLAQTPAIMEFLGRKHGYIPDGAEEQANCLQLALNAADIWAECYPARQSEDEGKEYTETRLPKWLSTLELFHDKTSGGGACECSGHSFPGAGRC